jgi:hypothetical protein
MIEITCLFAFLSIETLCNIKPNKLNYIMGKIGKIATLKRDYNNSQLQTMQGGLSAKGLTRIPGTGVFKYPYKELDGQYRTGLDVNAAYIRRIQDPLERELETERVRALKLKLEDS